MIPLILIFVIFYFLLIKPQQKKQKDLQEMIKGLKVGDKIMTTGGIYGVIGGLTNETISLKVADKVKLEVSRAAVAKLVSKT